LRNTFVFRSETPPAEDLMRQAAPSNFAEGKHACRSKRHANFPTIRRRIAGCTEFTEDMVRTRDAEQVSCSLPGCGPPGGTARR
jgi:hypothetical protein